MTVELRAATSSEGAPLGRTRLLGARVARPLGVAHSAVMAEAFERLSGSSGPSELVTGSALLDFASEEWLGSCEPALASRPALHRWRGVKRAVSAASWPGQACLAGKTRLPILCQWDGRGLAGRVCCATRTLCRAPLPPAPLPHHHASSNDRHTGQPCHAQRKKERKTYARCQAYVKGALASKSHRALPCAHRPRA